MTEEDKNARRARKSALTREVNNIRRLILEDDRDNVTSRITGLKEKFKEFENAHDKFHDGLTDDKLIEESEDYFDKVYENYIDAFGSFKTWLSSGTEINQNKSQAESFDKKVFMNEDLFSMMNLPKVEIEPFDGDPLKYHTFFALFDEHVHNTRLEPRKKLTRLIQYTCKEALQAILPYSLMGNDGYEEARMVLKKRFGSKLHISDHIIKSLRKGKPINTPGELQKLADELVSCQAVLTNMGCLKEIDTHGSILDIVARLQPYICNRWKRHAIDYKREKEAYPDFADFVKFVIAQAEEATDPVYGTMGVTSRSSSNFKAKNVATSFISDAAFERKGASCLICGQSHRLFACESFKRMKPIDRLEFVKRNRLCENCLLNNHPTSQCRKPSVCSVPNCGLKHTKFIHVDLPSTHSSSQEHVDLPVTYSHDASLMKTNEVKSVYASSNFHSSNVHFEVMVPIVKVNVNSMIDVCALLDNASTSSFCTEKLIRKLKVQGTKVNYTLNTISATQESKCGMVVDLFLQTIDGEHSLKLSNVYVVQSIPVNVPNVNLHDFHHLSDLTITNDCSVELLIGQDHAEALIPIEIRKGVKGEPFAVKTLLGWSINGPIPVSGPPSRQVVSHFIAASDLEGDLINLWNVENEDISCDNLSWSNEDKRVIKLWDVETKLIDGRYEIPIPWKPGVKFPNNYGVAFSRLKSLKKNLAKRGLTERYKEEIDLLLQMGYAEVIPEDELCEGNKIWYLPHQAVVTEKKPDKVRIVFDCASKFNGESLNDKAYQGPDIVNKLLDVLVRFRQHEFAIMSDIEAMYNQVRIPASDRDALRFLWQDDMGNVMQYRMTRHLFGGVWCACSSTYALRRVVKDNVDVSEAMVKAICDSFYVDDCLTSVPTEIEAIQIVLESPLILAKGGFKLTKFVVNSRNVLSYVPEHARAKEVKELTPEAKSKVLGVTWNVDIDTFSYKADVKCNVVTKRNMLSVVASLYDPLGLLSPLTVTGRVLFQDVARLKLTWDEIAPSEIQRNWNDWVESLEDLTSFQIPRCMKPAGFDDGLIELHHFSDASLRAYGSCSYLRCINGAGEIRCTLIMGKSRVAPLKSMTVPRLELLAAVMSAKADQYLRSVLDLKIANSYCWTDSEIVLKYIKNDHRRFHMFVGNRLNVITSATSSEQWHHVRGDENPADLLTRKQAVKTLNVERWLHGPKFLWDPKCEWIMQSIDNVLSNDDPEVKSEQLTIYATQVDVHPLDALIHYYSSWSKLKSAVAWLMRLRQILNTKLESGNVGVLTVDEIRKAEIILIKHVQTKAYDEGRESHLRGLNPMQNKDGLLCVGGRIKHGSVSERQKHPVIIPHGNPIAILIIRETHSRAHLGDEWCLSLIRSRFWITRARHLIKRVRRECITCKKLYGKPCTQKMADLPPERLAVDQPPFTFIGLDCFGPFWVKCGRSEVKRYGCIFTCLTTRAIHVEKLDCLETDTFLNGYRRFVARRGCPIKVFCDNGTNFVGAAAEISRSLRKMDMKKIHNHMLSQETEWHFNPPQASHMGGVWERLIGVIRRILPAMMKEERLTDEVLETLFVEVESIVNSRPLTKLSDHVDDLSPLTPNHLLLLRGGPVPFPGRFSQTSMYGRRWRYVQHLSNRFWKRWLKEYLPELQKRSKWLEKNENVKTGDLVLLMDENTPRGLWPLGLVVDVKFGRDGLVRSVTVKTRATTLVRPITKLVMLEAH